MPSCCDAVVAVRSGGEGWVKAGPAFPSRAIGARPGAIAHQAAGSFRLRTLASLEAIKAAGGTARSKMTARRDRSAPLLFGRPRVRRQPALQNVWSSVLSG